MSVNPGQTIITGNINHWEKGEDMRIEYRTLGPAAEEGRICPLLTMTSNSFTDCIGERCAWWNPDFGMCALAAAATTVTRPIALREQHK